MSRARAGMPGPAATSSGGFIGRAPPASFFIVSALFHYLGPAVAVLLFAHVAPLGVMWLRTATAAAVFAAWRRPWRLVTRLDLGQRLVLIALGSVLAGMNSLFYEAIARLPLATVGTIEFLGVIVLAATGARNRRNVAALVTAVCGVALLTVFSARTNALGLVFAFGNCAGFMAYVILGHRIANVDVGDARSLLTGIDLLGASMIVALVVATPLGFGAALHAFTRPFWLVEGMGVGVLSSVIPYVTDQLAMARLPRNTFALMLALLPACATVIGTVVLRQIPSVMDLGGIGLVVLGIALHRPLPSDLER